MKYLTLLVLAAVLLYAQMPMLAQEILPPREQIPASPKDETVFANISHSGSVETIYVVNAFRQPSGTIIDFGDYSDIINLSNQHPPEVNGRRLQFNNPTALPLFRYQGRLYAHALPWDFAFTYLLDGREVQARELLAATGRLEIALTVTPNLAAHSFFLDNYLIQISIPLPLDRVNYVAAPGANSIIVGNTLTISYTVLPGETGHFTLQAEVRDFAMGSIAIVATKTEISLGKMGDSLVAGFEELDGGSQLLVTNTTAFRNGLVAQGNGIEELFRGAAALNKELPHFTLGLDSYGSGIASLAAGSTQLSEASAIIRDGLARSSSSLSTLLAAHQAGAEAISAMLSDQQELTQLAQGLAQHPEPAVRTLAQAMLGQIMGLNQVHNGMQGANAGLAASVEVVAALAREYGTAHQALVTTSSGLTELAQGMTALQSAARDIENGVYLLSSGLNQLKDDSANLPIAAEGLLDGQIAIKEGLNQARQEIMRTIARPEVEKIVSFVAPAEARALSVQFVMRTPPIEHRSERNNTVSDRTEVSTLWQRITNLFRKLVNIFRG